MPVSDPVQQTRAATEGSVCVTIRTATPRSTAAVSGTPRQSFWEMTTSTGSPLLHPDRTSVSVRRETAVSRRFAITSETTRSVQRSPTPTCSTTPRSTARKSYSTSKTRTLKSFSGLGTTDIVCRRTSTCTAVGTPPWTLRTGRRRTSASAGRT